MRPKSEVKEGSSMEYVLGEFMRNLKNKCKYSPGLIKANMQSEEAIEAINGCECLPGICCL